MPPQTTPLQTAFNQLAAQWEKETAFHSNSHIITNHPAYHRIVAMGQPILPLVFKELEKSQTAVHWPCVLQAITGADPAPPPEPLPAGFVALDIKAIRQSWLQWGKQQGYRW